MKLGWLRLKGCGFTLKAVADNADVPFDVAINLLKLIYDNAGADSCDDYNEHSNPCKNTFGINYVFSKGQLRKRNMLHDAFDYGLLTPGSNGFILTDKAKFILESALICQDKLEKAGFFKVQFKHADSQKIEALN